MIGRRAFVSNVINPTPRTGIPHPIRCTSQYEIKPFISIEIDRCRDDPMMDADDFSGCILQRPERPKFEAAVRCQWLLQPQQVEPAFVGTGDQVLAAAAVIIP